MSVERAQRHLVKVDKPNLGHTRPCQRRRSMRADTTTANHYHKGTPQFFKSLGTQENLIPRKLFEDQLVVEVTVLCPPR
jgi:hypothetical protein